jgi:hypothetical protein
MKIILAFISVLFTLSLSANLSVIVSPTNPVAGESFEVYFTITTMESGDPFVSFDPYGLEVIGRRQEVAVQTQFINGKISTQRKVKLVYEMVSDKARTARLSNIKAEIASKVFEHKNVSIKITKTRTEAKAIFVQAEVDNVAPYIGQGVDVKYYLYTRAALHSTEIKQFPKLNGFIKRFHTVNNNGETVRVGNKLYKKILQYSARLYPIKSGTLKIDALRLIIRYSERGSNPFGSFGLAMGRLKERTVSSDTIKLEIKSLPSENVPAGFLGLIGRHGAKLSLSKSKYLINEPVEARLEIIGPGALEKMTAPILFNSNALEDFDIKADFVATDSRNGRKIFDYTYLARANTNIAARTLDIYYFSPNSNRYESVSVKVPAIVIGGGGVALQKGVRKDLKQEPRDKPLVEKQVNAVGIVAPLFTYNLLSASTHDYRMLFRILLIIFILVFLEYLINLLSNKKYRAESQRVIKSMAKRGLNYGDLTRVIFMLNNTSEDPRIVISEADLPEKDKKYFLKCLQILEYGDFSKGQSSDKDVKFIKKSFTTLQKLIENENIQSHK